MTGWQCKIELSFKDVFACNYWHCPHIGLQEDFHFNPSYRRGTKVPKMKSECPKCGNLGCHSYGSISLSNYEKNNLRLMRWQYRYFYHRDGNKCGITSKYQPRN